MKWVVVIGLGILMSACASQSEQIYSPDKHNVQTKTEVDSEFNQTWERMVENLSKSFFVINNIEKESRIINVSFSSSNPSKYVDCGYGELTVNGETRRIEFTENATYPYVYQQGMYKHVGSAQRRAGLDGRVNIFMKPMNGGSTEVSANAKYVLSVSIQRYTNVGQQYESTSDSMTFQSTSPGGDPNGPVGCRSTGELEEEILSMAESSRT